MTINQRISHLVEVGNFFRQLSAVDLHTNSQFAKENPYFEEMQEEITRAIHYNGWFTKENILFALEEWSKALTEENLQKWVESYSFEQKEPKTIGIIMAGNIPLVGFHDFISVLISGNNVLVKQSSNDQRLLPVIAKFLISIEPEYKNIIHFTEGRIENYDAVIATGSNNTARYFEYYFANKSAIIRKNRNSVAILTGNETEDELEALGNDIFIYFGLGCRNVSKLYVPKKYDFDLFYKTLSPWKDLLNHAKYANNYDYNKAVFLMSNFKFLDNGFLILKEDENFGSPIGTVFYEIYTDEKDLQSKLDENRSNLQCIVSSNFSDSKVAFGETQHPKLWDYADNVDTLAFLQNV